MAARPGVWFRTPRRHRSTAPLFPDDGVVTSGPPSALSIFASWVGANPQLACSSALTPPGPDISVNSILQGVASIARWPVAEGPLLDAQDEAELLHVVGQLGEREPRLFSFVQIHKLEVPEIAQQQVPGPLVSGAGSRSRRVSSAGVGRDHESISPAAMSRSSVNSKMAGCRPLAGRVRWRISPSRKVFRRRRAE